MSFHRSPFKEKQYNNDLNLTPKRATYRNQDIFYGEKQNPHRSSVNVNRKGDSIHRNTFLETSSKHITSQMITEYQNEFSERPERQYKRQATYQGKVAYEASFDGHSVHSKSTFEDQKKFNAKHFQIESKINKIQSYHQKIQTLLDMVNTKNKTSSKTPDTSAPLTPSKTYNHQGSSKSATKLSPLNLKSRPNVEIMSKQVTERQKRQQREGRQQKYGGITQSSSYYNKNSQEHFLPTTEHETYEQYNGRVTSKFQDGNVVKRDENQFSRENKYFPKENRVKAEQEFKQSARKKSKEYMKSIEGQVRDIQSTIELLNQKIKQVDQIAFKKQVVFDNLTTSNPESLSDNQQKLASQIQRSYTPSRTPSRTFNKQPQSRYHNQGEAKKINSNNNTYANERSFRKTSHNNHGTLTSSKYQQMGGISVELNGLRNDRMKMSNPYDGDVEPSEERNRQTLMQEIRRKRG